MNERWRRWRWSALAVALTLTVYVALTAHGGWWRAFGVQPMRPMFADWVNVLSAAETFAAGGDPYLANPVDPYRRLFSYGPWWLELGPIGLRQADAWWLGALLAVGFVAVAAVVWRPRGPGEVAWFCVLLTSPAVLLGVERGNSDLVVFVFLVLAGAIIGRVRSHWADVGAVAVLVVTAALKFYPLVALIGLGARRGSWLSRLVWMAVGAGAFWAAWWCQPDAYVRAIVLAARPVTVFTFGWPLLPLSWGALAQFRLWIVLGGVPVLAWGVWRLWRQRAAWLALFPLYGGRAAAAVAGTTTWLLCYGASTSYQYRGVLLLLAVPWVLAREGLRWLVGWLAVAFWLAAPLFWLLPIPIDERWQRWSALITGVQQALMAVVTLGLGLALLGWAWRRWQDAKISGVPAAATR